VTKSAALKAPKTNGAVQGSKMYKQTSKFTLDSFVDGEDPDAEAARDPYDLWGAPAQVPHGRGDILLKYGVFKLELASGIIK
jgi:hypothetical protein